MLKLSILILDYIQHDILLNFKQPDANAHTDTILEIHFIYLCNTEIYWTFDTCCNVAYFINFIFPLKIIHFT